MTINSLQRRYPWIMAPSRSLLALQDEMERQPSRHWQLFPNEIESGVSC